MRSSAWFLIAACAWSMPAAAFDSSNSIPAIGSIEYALTPGADAAELIVRTIDGARMQVLVQAFSFTHLGIANALVRAHRRGLDVQVIMDRELTIAAPSMAMRLLVNAGVPVFMDGEHAAAHNKVMIIDQDSAQPGLITGSFNFTFAAQHRNAENVLVVRGNPSLARAFYASWRQHRDHSIEHAREQ